MEMEDVNEEAKNEEENQDSGARDYQKIQYSDIQLIGSNKLHN